MSCIQLSTFNFIIRLPERIYIIELYSDDNQRQLACKYTLCRGKLRHAIALMWKQSTYENLIQLTCCDTDCLVKRCQSKPHIGKLRLLLVVRLLARLWETENCVTETFIDLRSFIKIAHLWYLCMETFYLHAIIILNHGFNTIILFG